MSCISRTNVASVGSAFNDTRKVKVLSLPETIKEKSTFRAKALRREENLYPWCIASERTFTFRVSRRREALPFAYHCLVYSYFCFDYVINLTEIQDTSGVTLNLYPDIHTS